MLLGIALLLGAVETTLVVRPRATCVLEAPRAAHRFSAGTAPSEWRWTLQPDDLVRCDAPGFEPVDLGGRDVAGPRLDVTLTRGRDVRIDADQPGVTHVEWRQEVAPESRRLARRSIETGQSVSAAPGRMLRIHRPASAPLTVFTDASTSRVALPPPVAGGEVVGRFAPSTFRPEWLLLESGGRSTRMPVERDGLFQAIGAEAGALRLVPLYRGGVRGAFVDQTVTSGQTTEQWGWRLPATGAAEIVAEPQLCADGEPRQLRLHSVAARSSRPFGTFAMEPSCTTTLEGLPPGRYRADLAPGDARSTLTSATFEVAANATEHVALTSPSVIVSGRVAFVGGQSADDVALVFLGPAGSTYETRTDMSGRYEIALGATGHYTVAVRSTPYLTSAVFERSYADGPQTSDFELAAGSLTIRIRPSDGSDLAMPVQFAARGPVQREGFLLPAEAVEFTLFGLDLGRYALSADAPPDLVCLDPVAVELTASAPAASVTILLSRAAGHLRVIGPDGQPVPDPRVQAGARILEQTAAGVYSLSRVSEGTHIWVTPRSPALLPTCRVAPGAASRDVEVNLTPRGTETLTLLLPADSRLISIMGLPGADCPVPLLSFMSPPERRAENGVFTLAGLPPGTYTCKTSYGTVEATVPGSPVRAPAP